MLRCVTRGLLFQLKDVKSKTLLERVVKAKVKAGVDPSDIDMEEVARESGLLPSNTANVQQFVQAKEAVLNMLQEQRRRRIARRDAFLEWQTGQREKGAAHRLLRQSRKAEKYKRHHYHAMSGRMVPVMPARHKAFDSVHLANNEERGLPSAALRRVDAQRCERVHLKLRKG